MHHVTVGCAFKKCSTKGIAWCRFLNYNIKNWISYTADGAVEGLVFLNAIFLNMQPTVYVQIARVVGVKNLIRSITEDNEGYGAQDDKKIGET